MISAERERAPIIAHLDRWATVPRGSRPTSADPAEVRAWEDAGHYAAGWQMCAFNAAREIERGDHLPLASASGVPLTKRRP